MTRYSLPPHEKMSAATRCQGLFGTSVFIKGSAGWRSAYVAQVAQACTYCRISVDMPGQNIRSLALLMQEFMPRWPTWYLCFIFNLMARGMTILCPLSISPSCAVNSSLLSKNCFNESGYSLLSLGQYFHDGILQCLGTDLWEPAFFDGMHRQVVHYHELFCFWFICGCSWECIHSWNFFSWFVFYREIVLLSTL